MNYPLVKPKDQPFKQGLEAIGRKKTTILFTSLSRLCRALLTKRKKWWWLERTWVHSVQGGKKKKATMVWVSFPSHKTSNFSDGWEKPVSGRKMEQKVTLNDCTGEKSWEQREVGGSMTQIAHQRNPLVSHKSTTQPTTRKTLATARLRMGRGTKILRSILVISKTHQCQSYYAGGEHRNSMEWYFDALHRHTEV